MTEAQPISEISIAFDGSEMGERVRAFDWSTTSLGPLDDWPPELKTAVALALESHFPKALAWGPDLITIHNDAFRPILGAKPDALGRSFADVWAEVWDELKPIADRAMAGEATFIENHPLRINRHGYEEEAYFTFCYSPIRAANGRIMGMMDTVIETTATVEARARMEVLNKELGHRLKNTMAMVQAIAAQTLRGVTERDAVEAFESRIVAMGHAHEVLLKQEWSAAAMRDVVEAAVGLHGDRAVFDIRGPEIQFGPGAVLSLTLLLHELATNAAKHGALSVPNGRVVLEWRTDGEGLILTWREQGGPPVEPPARKGFGSRLIGMGLMGTRKAALHYPRSGLEAEFRAPLRVLQKS